MPPLPHEEYVLIPLDLFQQSCEDTLQRLTTLVQVGLDDCLRAALEPTVNYAQAVQKARSLLLSFGRHGVSDLNGSPQYGQRVERTMETLGRLERDIAYLIGRVHGIHYQHVEFVRLIPGSGIVFRLVPLAIVVSPCSL